MLDFIIEKQINLVVLFNKIKKDFFITIDLFIECLNELKEDKKIISEKGTGILKIKRLNLQ